MGQEEARIGPQLLVNNNTTQPTYKTHTPVGTNILASTWYTLSGRTLDPYESKHYDRHNDRRHKKIKRGVYLYITQMIMYHYIILAHTGVAILLALSLSFIFSPGKPCGELLWILLHFYGALFLFTCLWVGVEDLMWVACMLEWWLWKGLEKAVWPRGGCKEGRKL